MGVYINIEMPTSCGYCPLRHEARDGDECYLGASLTEYQKRPDDCPLIPVQPHGRLGDLDRLEQMFVDIDNAPYSGFDGTEPFYSAEDAAQIIRLATTVIPAEPGEWYE